MSTPPSSLYDVTQPLDTSAANLLGADIRAAELNIQQRMACISGTLANRWNPGADAQPTNWAGLLYFATDTKQLFQWSGAAWVEITNTFLPLALINSASVRLAGQNAAIPTTTLYAVPAGQGGIYRVSVDNLITVAGTSGNITCNILWNNGISGQSTATGFVNVNPAGSESAGGLFSFYVPSGQTIQYNTQFNSVIGSPQYSLQIRLEYLS